jgi:hypothetical protein
MQMEFVQHSGITMLYKIRRDVLLFMMLGIISFHGLSVSMANDQYWISYSGDRTEQEPRSKKVLMKIDALGNIIVPPKVVITDPYFTVVTGATALSRNLLSNLTLWLPGRNRHAANFPIRKITIDKATLTVSSREKTGLITNDDNTMSVTQKKGNNFFVLRRLTNRNPIRNDLLAFSTKDPNKSWLLTECMQGDCTFVVSADGEMLSYTVRELRLSVFVQPLGPAGRPIGEPVFIARTNDEIVGDVSRPLKGGKRFCVYEEGASLFLQAIQSKTGKKIGERIRIAGNLGSPVIDPFGQFVVYISQDRLFFQALDALGNPSGTRKLLATGAGTGVDILKD